MSFGSSHHVYYAGTHETHIFSTAERRDHKFDGSECDTVNVHRDCPLLVSALRGIENRGDAAISDSQGSALRFFGLSSLL